jgi:RND family efflux transporter MFP subunit
MPLKVEFVPARCNSVGRSWPASPALVTFAVAMTILAPAALAQYGGPAPVAVAHVVERDVARGKPFVGTVMPLRTSTVGSAVDGRVIDYPINEGDRVEAGRTLAQLKTNTIQSELDAARAGLQLRTEELLELQNGSRPEEIEQAGAAMLAAQARMQHTAKEAERIRRLHEKGSAAEYELDAAITERDEAHQRYQAARATHDLAVAGPRVERIAQAAARVAVAEQDVLRLEDILSKHTIVSPFDGYVVSEGTEIGEWVSSGQAVAEVIELDIVEVRVLVVEDDAPGLRLGADVRVEVPALPGEVLTGVVSKIVPQADVRSRSLPVHVRVQNRVRSGQPLLHGGMFARVVLPLGEPTPTTLVPKDAIVLGGPTPVVFVVDPGQGNPEARSVRPVVVQLGVADNGMIEVTGDLHVGQEVVIEGNERLRPGQAVMVTSINGEPTARRDSRPNEVAPTP